jgi:hypothetical protein
MVTYSYNADVHADMHHVALPVCWTLTGGTSPIRNQQVACLAQHQDSPLATFIRSKVRKICY